MWTDGVTFSGTWNKGTPVSGYEPLISNLRILKYTR